MSKIISVCIPKGGVGKTTTAVNLAASLAVAEKKTLLIDVDPYGSSALALGFTPDKIKAGISDIFNFSKNINFAIHKTELEFLEYVPSNVNSMITDEKISKFSDNRVILKNALKDIKDNYDFIIIDCPPILRGFTTNAITASDSILIPIQSGHLSLDALDKLFEYLEWVKDVCNPAIQIEGILLTMYEEDKVMQISARELQQRYSQYLLSTKIPITNLLNEAMFYGKPLCLYNISSAGSEAYLKLAGEIISKNLN